MASILQRVAAFAKGPQGRRLAEQAKQAAQDPRNRARLEELRRRVGRKR